MQTSESPVLRDLVLVGGGHSHAGVLRMFGMRPEPGLRITLIGSDTDTPYSGMLPGYVAGHYGFDDVHMDLARLAAWAQARWVRDEVVGIDRERRLVLCRNRPALAYDLLSLNIGAAPALAGVAGLASAHDWAVPVKPIAAFNQRWQALLQQVQTAPQAMTVAVVGAGAGGVELLLAMQYRLQHALRSRGHDAQLLRFVLLSANPTLLPNQPPAVRARFLRVLHARGVCVHTQAEVTGLSPGQLHTRSGQCIAADAAFWVTQASAPAWLQDTGLDLDAQGFVQVTPQLQSCNDPRVFAAGDIAAFSARPLEKAGVFAVRMAKPLAQNLRRSLHGQALRTYRPQRHWLALISTGDRYAVASRGPLSWAGAWVWRWKDRIDRAFMRRFNVLPPMAAPSPGVAASLSGTRSIASGSPFSKFANLALSPQESQQAHSAGAMRCGGCGAKVGADVLSRALSGLNIIDHSDVCIGLHAPDDAAVVRIPAGMALVHSVDFFRAFIDDPYRFGKIAANHALGDIFAMGATPHSATAIATVPPGLERKVEELLRQMMAGAVEVLNAAGCALVGGHTGEGRELALGFAINGLIEDVIDDVIEEVAEGVIDDVGADASAPPSGPESKSHGKPSAKRGGALRKSGMQAGDLLILTKPIGTGTLLAAHARGQARGRWIDAALDCMTLSNQAAAQHLRQHGATACTDLTGFGLAGHVLEMANASAMGVELQLDALPLLEGASACVQAGISSSLQSANVRAEQAIENASAFQADARYPLLFDPQTAGGLLASVPAANAQACLAALHAAGYAQACVIGSVVGSVTGQVMDQVIDSELAPPQDRNAPASHAAKRIRLGALSAGLSGLAS